MPASKGRDHAIIDHPPGVETQWDWVELPDPPPGWAPPGRRRICWSGRCRTRGAGAGVLADREDLPHLVEAIDAVVARLGGLTQRWRFDRMSTVCTPAGRLSPAFAAVAKYYAVGVDVCPPRHGNRKGVVEKANHAAAQRWWRTLPDDVSVAAAQASLDARDDGAWTPAGGSGTGDASRWRTWSSRKGCARRRRCRIRPKLEVARTVSPQALVSFRGNQYSVGPGMAGSQVLVRHRLGTSTLIIATAGGAVLAEHRRAPDGGGAIERAEHHVVALKAAVLKGVFRCPPLQAQDSPPALGRVDGGGGPAAGSR